MSKFFSFLIIITGILFGALALHAQTTGNGSLSLVEDLQSDLFTLTVSDPDGVASFALEFKTGKLPYSGDLSGCQRSKTINNIAAINDADLAATVTGRVTDCRGGETEFEISAVDSKGKAQVKKLSAEPEPTPTPTSTPTPPPASEPTPSAPSEEVKASEVTFPVPELGNCTDKASCFAYCELPENNKKCLEFAKKHGLLPEDEIKIAEEVLGVTGGPGGCNSKATCESYCNNIDHIDECIAFAEKHGLMKGDELEEAKKVRAALESGQKLPGGCKNKNECENYCQNPDNMDECLAFAEASGFLPPEELEQARKFIPLMKSGQTPGGCRTKDQCEAYCESDDHFEECMEFAEKAGMIPEEEREHIEAFKKAGGKGPGGCKGRQCQAFCENPENQQACFEWAQENGLIGEEDKRRMEEGKQQIEKVFTDAPPEVQECINSAIPGGLEAMRSGKFFGGGEDMGDKIKGCFEEAFGGMMMGGPGGPEGMMGGPGEHGGFPGGPSGEGFGGPGGCKSIDECMAYCKEHSDECQGFAPPSGGEEGEHGGFQTGEKYVGPGGCATPDECIRYCTLPENKEECDKFHTTSSPPGGSQGRGPGGCSSVEECRDYCRSNPQAGAECDAFIGEGGDETKCQPDWEIAQDNQGFKYCSPKECPEGKEFKYDDKFGRRYCDTFSSGSLPENFSTPPPSGSPSQDQFQQQVEQ
ncbi:MAG: hypothetical protein AAB522_02030, partial [Patescibacteria group bacterium]